MFGGYSGHGSDNVTSSIAGLGLPVVAAAFSANILTSVIDKMLSELGGKRGKEALFFSVHFRSEGDNMWASPEEQMRVDLDALDEAWDMYRGQPEFQKWRIGCCCDCIDCHLHEALAWRRPAQHTARQSRYSTPKLTQLGYIECFCQRLPHL